MACAPRCGRSRRQGIALAIVAAAMGALVGCRDSVTAVRVVSSWTGDVEQLAFTIKGPDGTVVVPAERRPAEPAALTSPIDVVVFIDDRLAGKELTCEVVGYKAGATVAQGSQTVTPALGAVREAHVTLDAIRIRCASDADCGTGSCQSGTCQKRRIGLTCAANTDCASGHCVDKICCVTRCNTACYSCDQPDAMGQCRPVPEGVKDPRNGCIPDPVSTCGKNGLCDGSGGCARFPVGTTCKPPVCLGATLLQTESQCDESGKCDPGESLTCAPFLCKGSACADTCSGDMDCAPDPDKPRVCIAGSCGKKGDGQACTSGDQCDSTFCVDGVCCNESCAGACQSCSKLGQCTPIPAGQPDATFCMASGPSTCMTNGKCDGAGSCQMWGANTVCKPASCDTHRQIPPSTCDGRGRCPPPDAVTCGDYKCAGTACLTSCVEDMDCVYPATCIDGACRLKIGGQLCQSTSECTGVLSCINGICQLKPLGQSCTSGNQCASSFCTEGFCCNMESCGTCKSCKVPGSVGQCRNLSEGPAPEGQCPPDPVSTCDRNGRCDGNGRCSLYPAGTRCQNASCASPTLSVRAKTCDGAGTCVDRGSTNCGAYACNQGTGSCYSSCTSDAHCSGKPGCRNNGCK